MTGRTMTRELYECDYCGSIVPREDVTMREYPGHREKVVIPLCGDCEGYEYE